MSIQKKPVSYRFSEDTLKRIDQMARRLGMNRTELIERVITFYYNRIYSKDYLDL